MKRGLLQKLSAVLLGFSLAGTALKADTTNLVSLTTFEPGEGLRYNYPYEYSWGFTWPGSVRSFYVDMEAPDYTNSCGYFSFDNSLVAPFFPDPAAGYGFGFGGGLNWDFDTSKFAGTNREDYIVEFDCKVEGLSSGVTSGNGEFQVKFEAPDDTVSPPDADASVDVLVQFNRGFSAGSNWTHYVFTFEDANVDGNGNWARFVEHRSVANNINFGCNWNQPDPQFGFDDVNQVWIDNVVIHAIDRAPAAPLPTTPLTIFDWNLDDRPGWGYYGGYNWSQNTYLPLFTYAAPAAGVGVGGSNGWILTMDNSALAAPNTPAWAGGGTGGGGPADLARFGSGDLKAYQISFDARAEGLNPARTVPTTCRLQLFLDSPNGNMRVDFDVPAGSNWLSTTYLLSAGSFGTGSKAMFTTNYNTITGLRVQWQIENATSEADWAFDADNALIVDNVKLLYNAVGCPPLTITPDGNNIVVSWAAPSIGTAKLLSGNTPTTVNTEIVGATSPYTTAISGAPKYFRTQWVAP